jgi:hypothetical protein
MATERAGALFCAIQAAIAVAILSILAAATLGELSTLLFLFSSFS